VSGEPRPKAPKPVRNKNGRARPDEPLADWCQVAVAGVCTGRAQTRHHKLRRVVGPHRGRVVGPHRGRAVGRHRGRAVGRHLEVAVSDEIDPRVATLDRCDKFGLIAYFGHCSPLSRSRSYHEHAVVLIDAQRHAAKHGTDTAAEAFAAEGITVTELAS